MGRILFVNSWKWDSINWRTVNVMPSLRRQESVKYSSQRSAAQCPCSYHQVTVPSVKRMLYREVRVWVSAHASYPLLQIRFRRTFGIGRSTLKSSHAKFSTITVAARSKAWTVFARLNTGVVGSNPTEGMNICVYSVFMLAASRWADPPSKESYRLCIGLRNWKSGQGPKGCRAIQTDSTANYNMYLNLSPYLTSPFFWKGLLHIKLVYAMK
jgi:hypothetical protein